MAVQDGSLVIEKTQICASQIRSFPQGMKIKNMSNPEEVGSLVGENILIHNTADGRNPSPVMPVNRWFIPVFPRSFTYQVAPGFPPSTVSLPETNSSPLKLGLLPQKDGQSYSNHPFFQVQNCC